MSNQNPASTEATLNLRQLSHRMSNALEVIVHAEYLLGKAKLPHDAKKWTAMIAKAAQDAAQINREIRAILHAQNEKAESDHSESASKPSA